MLRKTKPGIALYYCPKCDLPLGINISVIKKCYRCGCKIDFTKEDKFAYLFYCKATGVDIITLRRIAKRMFTKEEIDELAKTIGWIQG